MTSHSDPTFRTYNPEEAVKYGEVRTSYPPRLYSHILQHHERTGGKMECLLDVGCGPGNATRDMSPFFDRAIGVDPGEQMITTAHNLGGRTRNSAEIEFVVCPAEKCASAPGIAPGRVDLLISAMAAHWFNMKQFWEQAAEVVKPGGTVALWTISSLYAHPETPNANEVNRALLRLERETLAPYETTGNRISRDMYDNLDMPWATHPDQKAFLRRDFVKNEWDRDGILTDGKQFYAATEEMSLDSLEKALETASMVTRWRADHPELVDTDKDCVKDLVRKLRPLLGEDRFSCSGSTAILLFKRNLAEDS